MNSDPVVHLLAIDWSRLPENVVESVHLRQAEIAELLTAACADEDLEMVIVATRQRFQVYTVGSGRTAGIRRVLKTLLGRARGFTRLGQARVIEASGVAAARELFRAATGLDSDFAIGLRGLYAVTTAAALAAETRSIGEHLAALFAHANTSAWLAHRETEHASPLLPSERRELARFEVERLVEEQLLVWQSSYADRSVEAAPDTLLPAEYSADETSSIVRVKLPAVAANESVA